MNFPAAMLVLVLAVGTLGQNLLVTSGIGLSTK